MRALQDAVSEACQINDLDHDHRRLRPWPDVSEACQINDLDHTDIVEFDTGMVSEACQINDLDHLLTRVLY